MKFEFYVMRYDFNHHSVYMFNIFNNIHVQKWTEQAVRKYIRSPKKYKYSMIKSFYTMEEDVLYGFDALCAEIKSILMNQLWSRREYEINVSDAFTYEIRDIVSELDKYDNIDDLKEELRKIERKNPKLEKWDCFNQCEPNIKIIAHEAIRQYKEQLKENKNA